ncbi:tyrosine-type recombinase/integrase [Streptomyces sp. NPDC006602]|uniref:tyrosine-type recombinase/integrase n=1 Tax=Streptomyces sp. NPDC006602 TaxID=3364751 RepID=UPI00367AF9BF
MTEARPTATGAPGYTETMPCEPESARRARLLVSAALSAWGIGELAGVGVQIVAELVNNAIDHTRCRVVRVLVTRPAAGVVEALLFTAPQGGPLRARNFRQRFFAPAVVKAELGHLKVTPHKLRHTAASLAIASGADVNVVQTMLGHKSATLTLDTYGHLFPDRLDEVSKKMHKRRAKQLAKAKAKLEKAERMAREAAEAVAALEEGVA